MINYLYKKRFSLLFFSFIATWLAIEHTKEGTIQEFLGRYLFTLFAFELFFTVLLIVSSGEPETRDKEN